MLKPYNTSQGKPLLPWESYRDWLRLQTIYFDATEVLAQYVTLFAPSVDISIKILSSSPPDDKMLSWEGLLCAQRYFLDTPNFLHQPPGKELFNFLSKFTADQPEMEHKGGDEKNGKGSKQKGLDSKQKKGNDGKAKRGKGSKAKEDDCSKDMKGMLKTGVVGFETVIELVKELQKSEVVRTDLVDSVVNQMKRLKYYLSPEDDKHVKNTCQKISDLRGDNLTPQH